MSEQQDWTKIDPGFGEKGARFSYEKLPSLNYQQIWEGYSLTYVDAEAWIKAGWKVDDYNKISKWINYGFSAHETGGWNKTELEIDDYHFAAYLRGHDYTPEKATKKITELRREYEEWLETPATLADYLNLLYPFDKRERVRQLVIGGFKPLTNGIINGREWSILKKIHFSHVKLDSLQLLNCAHLTSIVLSNCQIKSNLEIFSELMNLERLQIRLSWFVVNLSSLSQLVNLESLNLENNPLITGSLKSLQKLTKLRILNISNTNINEELEYLPAGLEMFECKTDQNSNLQSKHISKLIGKSWLDWKEANEELIKLLLTTDQLELIQEDLNNFFNANKDFATQYLELKNNEKWIKCTKYVNATTVFITSFGAALGGYYAIPAGWIGFSAGLIGMGTNYLANDYLEKEKQLIENKWGEHEVARINRRDSFIEETAKLEIAYSKLDKIFTKLSLLSNIPSNSAVLNQAFTNFLESMQSCKEQIAKALAEKDWEQGWKAMPAVNFTFSFQKNLLVQHLNELITAVAQHRKEMYQLEYKDEKVEEIMLIQNEHSIPLQTL